MDERKQVPPQGEETHDFFACPHCKDAGRSIEHGVSKIRRWAAAMLALTLPAEIGEDESDPPEPKGFEPLTVTEGLAHAIFYEAERLESDLPSRAVCSDEWERQLRAHEARTPLGPKAVRR